MKCNRSGILTFCGEDVQVTYDPDGVSCKEGFRLYDDGHYKTRKISSSHPNILRSVIIGKKSWGLWLDQWTDGISDGSFTKYEILEIFRERNIIIPESFLLDFENRLWKKRMRYYEQTIKEKT